MINSLLLIVFFCIIAIGIYYVFIQGNEHAGCRWCPRWGDCPKCSTTTDQSQQVLSQIAKGCVQRLSGIASESLVNASNVQEFMESGVNRLVIITNVQLEDFVSMIYAGDTSNLEAATLVSTVQNGAPSYLVMKVSGGEMGPIGSPTSDFDSAFAYLESVASEIGPDTNNLVFFIDEDIPCEEEAVPVVEKCCGKRF